MLTKTLDELSHMRKPGKSTISSKIRGTAQTVMSAPMDPGTKAPKAPDGQPQKSTQDKYREMMLGRGA